MQSTGKGRASGSLTVIKAKPTDDKTLKIIQLQNHIAQLEAELAELRKQSGDDLDVSNPPQDWTAISTPQNSELIEAHLLRAVCRFGQDQSTRASTVCILLGWANTLEADRGPTTLTQWLRGVASALTDDIRR